MIELYTWCTPNGYKVSILLEELAMPYQTIPIDMGKGDQFAPDFLVISPNNKIPAIVDTDGPDGAPVSIFESGAILLYLAEKTGRFFPSEPRGRIAGLEWLMFQMGGIGPMLGQNHHFRLYAPDPIEYAIARYTNEAKRLYGVLDRRLDGRDFVIGDYSIVDMAIFPWIRNHKRQGITLDEFPHIQRWFDAVAARPAVQRGLTVPPDPRPEGGYKQDKAAWDALFGTTQYQKR
jgi:GSH-dependent disulfide-bond oxidoreductase